MGKETDGTELEKKRGEEYSFPCGKHCKLCPFPGYKCHGRPTKLNEGHKPSPFAELYTAENSAG